MLDGGLMAAKRAHRVTVRHAVAQRLERATVVDALLRVHAHAAPAGAMDDSLTSEAMGFVSR